MCHEIPVYFKYSFQQEYLEIKKPSVNNSFFRKILLSLLFCHKYNLPCCKILPPCFFIWLEIRKLYLFCCKLTPYFLTKNSKHIYMYIYGVFKVLLCVFRYLKHANITCPTVVYLRLPDNEKKLFKISNTISDNKIYYITEILLINMLRFSMQKLH